MAQRVHINPNQTPGYRPTPMQTYMPDPIGRRTGGPGTGHVMGGTAGLGTSSDGGPLDEVLVKVRGFTNKVEDLMESYSQPIKPWVPAIARFLIVVTFLEDALRIVTQWGDQLWYLQKHRGFYRGFSHLFLLFNIFAMVGGSYGVISKRFPEYSVGALLAVVVAQGLGYGLIFDMSFFLRNLSVIGGLLMVLSDSLQKNKKLFAGLPSISENDRRKYFQLAGRVLLVFLFVGFVFQGQFSVFRLLVSLFGLGACVMVAVGFKAKWSASFLVTGLSVANVFVNNWWSLHPSNPTQDFKRFDFFQTLSIVGGLLLLVNMGPGGLSMDEKKKVRASPL
ncbi:ER-derived vesicles protein erv29 [Naganishia albida]|nr:ER-derived vesicles protein erv29 [Naganishia albida]